MAKKPTITTVSSGFASNTQINSNFTALRDAFDNTLSRDGSTPNTMLADLDLNGNDILNVGTLEVQDLTVSGAALGLEAAVTAANASAVAAAESAAAAAIDAASINLPSSLTGKSLNYLRVLNDESGYEHRTPDQVLTDIGGQSSAANLTALSGVSANGLLVRTGTGTAAARTITAGTGITVADGDGVSGNPTIAAIPMRGQLSGLLLSNNGSDANNDIDIAIGEAASDDTTPVLMQLTSVITKRLDAAWAVGTNQGGLDTGSKANSTWYYLWLIRRPDTGVVDVLFSASATSPTMPTNYTQKASIAGAIRTDGSGNIRAFAMAGRSIYWNAPVQDYSAASARSLALLTITVPPIVTRAMVQVTLSFVSTTGTLSYQIGGSNVASPPTITFGTTAGANGVLGAIDPPPLYCAAGQIYFGGGGTASTTTLFTLGFEDTQA